MTTKEQLHELVDQLTDDESEALLGYLLQRRDERNDPSAGLFKATNELREGLLISGADFNRMPRVDLATLAAQQGIKPISDFDSLFGDFWPEDESIDAFIATIREWRTEGERT